MVQNILKWLQGVYTQQTRRSRFAEEFPSAFLPYNGIALDRVDDYACKYFKHTNSLIYIKVYIQFKIATPFQMKN